MWTKNEGGSPGSRGMELEEAAPRPSDNGDSDEVIAFVGKGVEFKGVITYNGTVRIDGRLDGEIHTDGVLMVGQDAVITARITAGTVITRGQITGDIEAAGRVRLLSPAVLNGSVKAPVVAIEEGVLFNGSLEMARAEQSAESTAVAVGSTAPVRVSSTMRTVSD